MGDLFFRSVGGIDIMNRRTVLSLAAAAFVALLSSSHPVTAQPQFPGGPGGGGPFGPRGGNIVDPSRSAISMLIRRDDVRSQIVLTARQREALDNPQEQQQAQQEIGNKMRDLFSGLQ